MFKDFDMSLGDVIENFAFMSLSFVSMALYGILSVPSELLSTNFMKSVIRSLQNCGTEPCMTSMPLYMMEWSGATWTSGSFHEHSNTYFFFASIMSVLAIFSSSKSSRFFGQLYICAYLSN